MCTCTCVCECAWIFSASLFQGEVSSMCPCTPGWRTWKLLSISSPVWNWLLPLFTWGWRKFSADATLLDMLWYFWLLCRHIYFWASLTENSVRSHLWIFPLARNLAENFVYPQPINKPVKLLYLCVLWVQVQVRNVIVYSWRFLPLPQIVLIYCILILKTFLFNLLWPVFRAVSRVFHCFKGKKGSWYSL